MHYLIVAVKYRLNFITMSKTGKSPENYLVEDFITDTSFINYFFRLNVDDVTFWEKWILSNPDYKESIDEAEGLLRSLTLTLSDEEMEAEIARMKIAINADLSLQTRRRPAIVRLLHWGDVPKSSRAKRNKITRYIFPLILVFLIGGYFILKQWILRPDRLVEKYNSSSNPIVFSLPDGTVITLAAQSVLRYPSGFGEKDRNVFLDGEAQFNVSRETASPFKVHEGDIIATVLGTVFNVKKQAGDSVMLVELLKGKLKVENIDNAGQPLQSFILNPDERVVYTRYNQRLYKEIWQPQTEEPPFEVNHIVFLRSSFAEIATKIKSVFGVTVINQSKKKNWLFSGEFENATAGEIVENICLVEGLKSQVNGNTIIVK